MKFCKDCKYCQECWARNPSYESDGYCIVPLRSLVTGNSDKGAKKHCTSMRSYEGRCGPDAKLWKPNK